MASSQQMPGDASVTEAGRLRAAIGAQYFKTALTLLWLTLGYYVLVTVGDIVSPPDQFADILYISDGLLIVMLLGIHVLQRRGIINETNAHYIPIPVAMGMIFNGHCHVMASGDPVMLIKFIMMIFAFGVVAMLRWIFWLIVLPTAALFIVAASALLGPDRFDVFILGVGTVMISYGAFVVRFNAIQRQIELTLANEERAEKLATLSQAKDQFIANMSHELRTPLTGLVGMVDLIDERGLNSKQQEGLSIAKKSANTLRTIINDVLDLSRLDAGQLELDHAPFDAKRVTQTVADMLGGRAQEKGLRFVVDLEQKPLPLLDGDEGRIRQILLNLLGNAVKFTEVGAVTLSVKARQISDEAVTLRWGVEDTGIGIPKDQRARLFNRFAQVDASSTRGRSGTGLGLAISKELAVLMGSDIEVASTLGRGSCFWMDVTFTVAEQQAAQGADTGQDLGWIRKVPLSILIVEDNPVNQLLIRRLLSAKEWRQEVADNGEKAVELAAQARFDIIFMDIQMPIMDGVSATEAILSGDGPNWETPIYALTANCLPEDQARYQAAGMKGHIGKPIDPQEMDAAIARALEERGVTAKSASAKGAAE